MNLNQNRKQDKRHENDENDENDENESMVREEEEGEGKKHYVPERKGNKEEKKNKNSYTKENGKEEHRKAGLGDSQLSHR